MADRPRGEDPSRTGLLLASAVLVALVAALLWAGLESGHIRSGPQAFDGAATAPGTPSASASQPQSPTPTPPDPDHAAGFATLSTRLQGTYALAWVDADGLHSLGSPADELAWSTIKVPLAIAALEDGTEVESLVERAVAASDNEAGAALWRGLGPPEEAAKAVDEVLTAYRSAGTRTQSEVVRPGFSAFGQTVWNVQDQARFASRLACALAGTPAAEVRDAMGRVIPDQRWGLAGLEDARVKGGWGPGGESGYVVRQFGDALADGRRYALAASARAADGSYAQGASDLTAVVQWWAATVVPSVGGISCR